MKIQENAYIFGKYKLNHPKVEKRFINFYFYLPAVVRTH